jgi:NADPH2:quinone reductase
MPGQVQAALSAVTGLTHRGVLREPPPATVPLDDAAKIHLALETRSAPPRTVLAMRG